MKLVERVAIGLVTVLLGASAAQAQGWVPLVPPNGGSLGAAAPLYSTYAVPVSSGLVTVYAAGQTAAVPAAWNGPVCGSAAVAHAVPYLAAYAPATAYRPAVTVNYVPPTLAYSPLAAPVHPAAYAAQPLAAGRRVWVKPKVYVEGQPLRNLLRAITP